MVSRGFVVMVTDEMAEIGQDAAVERLRFLTLHLHDLQSIRWAPLWLALAGIGLGYSVPVRVHGNTLFLVLLFAVAVETAWFCAVRLWTRRVYGRPTLSQRERSRVLKSRPIQWLYVVILVWPAISRYALGRSDHDWPLFLNIAIFPLMKVVDKTNPLERRLVYGLALGLFVAVVVAIELSWPVEHGLVGIGALFVLLGVYDSWLLARVSRHSGPPVGTEAWHG